MAQQEEILCSCKFYNEELAVQKTVLLNDKSIIEKNETVYWVYIISRFGLNSVDTTHV